MNLLRAASTISLFTLASRVTGLVRDVLLASMFGASAWMDAFNVAFRIPNLLRRLFAEGAFSQAFVPVLARTRAAEGDEATRRLIDSVATMLFWALVVACAIGIAAAPVVVWLMASGLERFDGAVLMTRLMFPYIGFMSMVALSAGVLNTWKRFAVPAVTPVLLNLSVIGAAWALAPSLQRRGIEPIYALTAGVIVGGALQLAVQLPALARIGAFPRLGLTPRTIVAAWHHPGVRRILAQMGPALVGVSVAQFSMMINTQIASHQGVGAVSWLTYADRLMEFPTALLGVALGMVLTPQLAAAQGRGDAAGYSALLDWGLRLVLLLALPCAVALLLFSNALVAVLFQRGAFSVLDVQKTVSALMGYGVGLVGLIAVKILAPGFYARQDTRTPVRIAVGVLVLTQLFNLIFVPFLGHAGLALSIGAAALVNAGALFAGLRRAGAYTPAAGWGAFALRLVLANVALGALLAWGSQAIDWVGLVQRPWVRIGWLAAYLAGAAALYFTALRAMGMKLEQFARRG
jgi:putative peptidoglycan lipid II flippase